MRIKLVLCILILLFTQIIFGQSKGIKPTQLKEKDYKEYQDAIKAMRSAKAAEANKKLDKIIKKLPTFYEAKLRKAAWLYELNDFDKAGALFKEVIAADPLYDIEMYNSAATNAIAKKDYSAAAEHLKTYLEKAKIDDSRKKEITDKYNLAFFRAEAYKNPKPFKKELVKGQVNTVASEFLPFITIDGNQMVFTRRSEGFDDLFLASRESDGSWGKPAFVFNFDDDNNRASASFSSDGLSIAFTMCNLEKESYGSCDIYMSRYENNKWIKPYNIGNVVNTAGWESQPCLIDNGKALVFSSNRKGSLGGNDLFISRRGKNNAWTTPENLGSVVNTGGNEESPFLHPDGKTLFFRSTGHPGMGSYDLFYSKYDPIKNIWSSPINLGYPINTEGQEGALFVERDGLTAYYTSDVDVSNRPQKHLDIFSFILPSEFKPEPTGFVKINIMDKDKKGVSGANYKIIDLVTKDTVLQGSSTGQPIIISLPSNKNYGMYIDKPTYYPHSENFNTSSGFDLGKAIEKTVVLNKIDLPVEKPIVLNNIFFETGKADLLPTSQSEIAQLTLFLQSNPQVKIKVVGHTDNVGNDQDNIKLSEARAKAVIDALIKMGISQSRLTYEGKGKSSPIADNATEEGRRLNRRTEFAVVK
jgi:outer membrane protein OmpA-like peptidoglycan-associated protein/tetratricopeptide (TPR) repeat protein